MSDSKTEMIEAPQVIEVSASSNIFPKEAVEGVLAEMVNQIKASLDVVIAGKEVVGLTKLENARGCYIIAGQEVEHTLQLLRDYSNAALTVKHRFCRAIMKEFLQKLYKIPVLEAKSIRNKSFVLFAQELVEFITTFHKVLHHQTDPRERQAYVYEYCGYTPQANGDLN